jgi:hypothetical protein
MIRPVGVRPSAPLAALVCLLLAAAARADAPSPAELNDDLLTYYGGERASAYFVLGFGLASAGAGGYLVTRHDDFSRGLGWPLLSLGAIELLGGIGYAFTVSHEIAHYQAALATDPKAFRDEELAHIEGTTRRFGFYRAAELGIAVVGAGLLGYGLAADRDVYKGVGSGLMIVGVPFFVMDTLNNNRAQWYLGRLRAYQPTIGVSFTGHTAALAVSGTF